MIKKFRVFIGLTATFLLAFTSLPATAAETGVSVTGSVKNTSNVGLSDATVQLETLDGGCSNTEPIECVSWSSQAKTDALGNFEIPNVHDGSYRLWIVDLSDQYPAFVFYPGVGTSSEATIITVSGSIVSNLVTTIPLAGRIQGSVPNAAPGGKARATLVDGAYSGVWNVSTDSNGNFIIPRLFPGVDYLIYGTSPGSWSQYIGTTGSRLDANRYQVTPSTTLNVGRLEFKSPGTISGAVFANLYGSGKQTTITVYDMENTVVDIWQLNQYFNRLDYNLRLFTGTYYLVYSRGDGDDQGAGGYHQAKGEAITVENGQTVYAPQINFPLADQNNALGATLSGSTLPGSIVTATLGPLDAGVTVAYRWTLDGANISGQNTSSLLLTGSMVGKRVRAFVTASKQRTRNQEVYTSSITVSEASFTTTSTPTLTGLLSVGETLTAEAGQWDAGATLSYQWFIGGVEVPGAQERTYTLESADLDKLVSVKVTGTQIGYRSTSLQSEGVLVSEGSLDGPDSSSVDIDVAAGKTLSLNPGEWEEGVVLSYQWLRNGEPIAGATSSSYKISSADFNQRISARVTGSKNGYSDLSIITSSVLAAAGSLTLTPTPEIQGPFTVGSTLNVQTGTWDDGVTFAYQWFRSGQPISGATERSYQVSVNDFGSNISVEVTGSKAGSEASTQESNGYSILEGDYQDAPRADFSGVTGVGQTLTAIEGSFSGNPQFSYAWMRDGVSIVGATSKQYSLTSADAGKAISVQIRTRILGFNLVSSASASRVVALGVLAPLPVPMLLGVKSVGNQLTVSVSGWSESGTIQYTWMRNGTAIVGANQNTYRLSASDLAREISVLVRGTKQGYESVTAESQKYVVSLGTITVITNPVIQVPAAVGKSIAADAGTWSAGTTLAYQWFRNRIAISGATSRTYALVAVDLGAKITYSVTGRKDGYASKTVQSQPIEVRPGQLATINPAIAGAAVTGKALKAIPGIWPAGVRISYQWLRDGKAIAGATSQTYKVTKSDLKKTINVRVTATKAGYKTVAVVNKVGLKVTK